MFVGIDIGGTNIKGVLADKNGRILSDKAISTPENSKEIDKSVNQLVEILATSCSFSKMDIKAIGIGVAGTIDREKGTIITSPNIKDLKNFQLVKKIEKLTGIKVFLENDATTAVIGAWWKGNGSKFSNWIMLTLGTGIGGGLVIDGKIYTGRQGNSMEIGHTTIVADGKECGCGNKGCLEQYASATALVKTVQEKLSEFENSTINERIKKDKLNAKLIYEEAVKGDELALLATTEVFTYLGIGVANLVNIFSPEAIIFGGGMSKSSKLMIPIVKRVVNEKAMKGLKEKITYLPIKDQSRIPALGAVKMAMDAINAIPK